MFMGAALGVSGAVFVGTFLLGESVILAAAAMAGQGTWPVTWVAGWAFAGTVISDVAWFTAANRGIAALGRNPERARKLDVHARRLDRWTGARPCRALLFIKFVYGTRILSIAYLSLRKVSRRRFASFDAAGTAIWLAVIIPIGYLAGRGLGSAGVDLVRFEGVFAILVVLAVAARALVWWRHRR